MEDWELKAESAIIFAVCIITVSMAVLTATGILAFAVLFLRGAFM